MSGIKEVAKLAGVSISTVSNVLNKTRYVSPELTKRVEQAAKILSYEADPIARGMKGNNTGTIGVIVEDISGVFYPYLVKGIDIVANEKGYQIIICDAGGVYGDIAAIDKEKQLFKRLVNSRVDGILFVSCVKEEDTKEYLTWIKQLVDKYKKTPIVSLERDFSQFNIDSVYFDSYENAKMAVQHLINIGCKNIGYISGPEVLQIAAERTRGFLDCMKANGMTVNNKIQMVNGDYSHQSGYIAMKTLYDNYPTLDGVFVANDQMAIGAIKFLKEYEIKIPEKVKIVGYDDLFFSSMIEPSLTTVHIRKCHTGVEAAKILFDRIQNGYHNEDTIKMRIDSRLIIRKSTVANAPEDWIFADW